MSALTTSTSSRCSCSCASRCEQRAALAGQRRDPRSRPPTRSGSGSAVRPSSTSRASRWSNSPSDEGHAHVAESAGHHDHRTLGQIQRRRRPSESALARRSRRTGGPARSASAGSGAPAASSATIRLGARRIVVDVDVGDSKPGMLLRHHLRRPRRPARAADRGRRRRARAPCPARRAASAAAGRSAGR